MFYLQYICNRKPKPYDKQLKAIALEVDYGRPDAAQNLLNNYEDFKKLEEWDKKIYLEKGKELVKKAAQRKLGRDISDCLNHKDEINFDNLIETIKNWEIPFNLEIYDKLVKYNKEILPQIKKLESDIGEIHENIENKFGIAQKPTRPQFYF